MKAIILAGGYAKRLLPITEYISKPLLRIGDKCVIDFVVDSLDKIDRIDDIIITTNKKFEHQFREWLAGRKSSKSIKLVVEETTDEKEKLGAIGGIHYVIEKEGLKDDCLIIAGDNLFDFSLEKFMTIFSKKKSPIIAAFDVMDPEKSKLYGVLSIDKDSRITDFVEKPPEPKSTLVSTGCYIFPKSRIHMFSEYLKEGNNKDSPGFFIQWLHKKHDVFAYRFNSKWYDIGDKKSLEDARKKFISRTL